ncbi:MAG: phosphatase PAP2 family protein [Nitrospirae bacterium]|nr:phosphatase PAP2 family protein [Nitrospirota bacterium]
MNGMAMVFTRQTSWVAAAIFVSLALSLAADPWVMAVRRGLDPVPPPLLWITHAGNGAWQALATLLLFGTGWALKREPLRRAGLLGLAAFLGAGLAVEVLKHLLGVPRPRLWMQGVAHFGPSLADGLDSFPSGHTSTSFALAVLWGRMFPAWRWPLWASAGAISLSRVAVGSHFPSDVMGGAILGSCVGWLVAVGFPEGLRRPSSFRSGIAWAISRARGAAAWSLLLIILLLGAFRGPALSLTVWFEGVGLGLVVVGGILGFWLFHQSETWTSDPHSTQQRVWAAGGALTGIGFLLIPEFRWVAPVFVGTFLLEYWVFVRRQVGDGER